MRSVISWGGISVNTQSSRQSLTPATKRPRTIILGTVITLGIGALGFTGFAAAQADPDNNDTSAAPAEPGQINPHLAADAFAADYVVDNKPAEDLPRSGNLNRNGPEMKAVASWLAVPTTTEQDSSVAAIGPAAEQMANLEDEFEREGWKQVGEPKVVGTPTSAPITIDGTSGLRITACLNDASVKVIGPNGRVVRPESQGQRVLNTFDLIEDPDVGWKVVATGFPSDPRC